MDTHFYDIKINRLSNKLSYKLKYLHIVNAYKQFNKLVFDKLYDTRNICIPLHITMIYYYL